MPSSMSGRVRRCGPARGLPPDLPPRVSPGSFHAARAQEQLLPVTVELGDVSLTKLPFVMAAEAGIYRRNGLAVKQFITPNAAELIRRGAGLVVPKEFVGTGAGDINIGGGSPTLVRMTSDARAPQRVVLATTDDVSRFHIVGRQDLAGPQDLKGKRIGFSGVGALEPLRHHPVRAAHGLGLPCRPVPVRQRGGGRSPAQRPGRRLHGRRDRARGGAAPGLQGSGRYRNLPVPDAGLRRQRGEGVAGEEPRGRGALRQIHRRGDRAA